MSVSVSVRPTTCRYCSGQRLIGFGTTEGGKPRFRCHDCQRTFCLNSHTSRLSDPAFVSQVLAAYHERMSMRGVARVFKMSRTTLSELLKKSQKPA